MSLRRYQGGPSNEPALDRWLAERVLAGWKPAALVVASGGTFTMRTAYRWRAQLVRLEDIVIGDHVATFAIRRTQPPVRIEPWRRVR